MPIDIIANMKITTELGEDLPFASYFFCSSSSIKVSNNIFDLNGIIGSSYNNKSNIGSRIFSIQGNIEATSLEDVERFRGDIFSALANRMLKLYLEDDFNRYYLCVLDGNVNTTYNQGWNIGRVFTLSFNLFAPLPFSFGKENKVVYEGNAHTTFEIDYNGNVPCVPCIKIIAKEDIELKKRNKPFLKCKNTFVQITKNILLKKGDEFLIKNGLPLLNDTHLVNVFNVFSILNPLLLLPKKNQIEFDTSAVCMANTDICWFACNFEMSWNDMYY